MANQGLLKAHALCQGGPHVVLAQFLESGIFHEEGEEGKFANHVAEDGQHQMVAQVRHLPEKAEILKVVAGKAPQREYVQIGTSRQEDNQEDEE